MSENKGMDPDFFKEEVRSGYRVSEQMKRVWACQLDLLEELLRVCRKYNLKCWADSGTLIGAVRHNGYIPWDDDIDMIMFREDYDKLVAVADKEFRHPYFFQTIYSDVHYNHRHAQLRNSETAAISEKDIRKKYNQGIFIDIFILDSFPKTLRQVCSTIRKVKLYRIFVKLAIKFSNYLPDNWYRRWRWDVKMFERYEGVLRHLQLSETQYVSCISLHFRQKIRNKDSYAGTEWRKFEHTKIPVPVGYDEILRLDYGDYMTQVQAPTRHGSLIFDTERDYETVRLELKRKKKSRI